jgi:SpoVK/Ycf46/Vps4 family AAA+-type ATPase
MEITMENVQQTLPSEVASEGTDRRGASRARSDSAVIKLLPKLARAVQWKQFGAAVEILNQAAELVADRYPAVARSVSKQMPGIMEPKRLVALPENLVTTRVPRHGLDAVVVNEATASECKMILDEHSRREALAAFKLEPRHKLLLSGPPGNGKTMLAEAFAHELDVPYLVAKPSGLLASYMGETGKNLTTLMDYAASGPCVLFFDEFEGVSKQRGVGQDVGEIHRVTNQLLVNMDELPSHVMFICATNLDDILDKAIVRRFDFHIQLPAPTEALRLQLAKRELDPALTPGHDLQYMATDVVRRASASLHQVAELCRQVRRQLALYGEASPLSEAAAPSESA